MRRRLLALTGALALALGLVVVPAATASAAQGMVATSVALNDSAGCTTDADLDLGAVVDVATETETGLVTNLDGDVIGEFSQSSDWDGTDGVVEDYGNPIDVDQPEGTVIGSYASAGNEPFTTDSAIEWFVLYRCSDVGENIVLYSCFGDFGTCPDTAEEGAAAAFGGIVTPTVVEPGDTITVDGEGCLYPLAGAILLRDGEGLGVGDVVVPEDDGSYLLELVVPAGLTPGALDVRIDCGFDGETVLSETVALEVIAPVVPTTAAPTTTTTTAAPTPAVVTPRFTG